MLEPYRRYWIVPAFVLLAAPMLVQMTEQRQIRSEREARMLAVPPAWPRTLAALRAWPRAVDQFLADHFGLREPLVRANALLRYALRSPTNLFVLYGQDGHLFFDGDAMIAQSMGLIRRQREIDRFADFAKALDRKLRARGAQFLVAIPPNSATIAHDVLPNWAQTIQVPTEYDLMLRALGERGVAAADLRPALLAANDRQPVYRSTDTHWNNLGALIGYNTVVQSLEKPDWTIDPTRVLRGAYQTETGGDLARMLGVSAEIGDTDMRIDLSAYDPPPRTVSEIDTKRETGGDLVETGHAGPTVLVLGDSFTRHFWRDYFTLHAGRYVWIYHELCDFVPKIADSYNPDIVVLAPTERFMFCWNMKP